MKPVWQTTTNCPKCGASTVQTTSRVLTLFDCKSVMDSKGFRRSPQCRHRQREANRQALHAHDSGRAQSRDAIVLREPVVLDKAAQANLAAIRERHRIPVRPKPERPFRPRLMPFSGLADAIVMLGWLQLGQRNHGYRPPERKRWKP